MIIKYISNTFREFYKTVGNKSALEYEHKLVGIFGSFLMITGAITSSLSLHFFMNIEFAELWFTSLGMFVLGIIVFAIPSILKNATIKLYLLSVLYAAYSVFVAMQYFEYIGPAVWTISICIIAISLLYTKRHMLIIVLTITLFNVGHFAFNNIEFNNWGIFYQAEIGTLIILATVIITINNMNNKRTKILLTQFNDIVRAEEKLKLTLESVGDGVITVNEEGFVELMNPIAQKLTGWNSNEAIGEPFGNVFDIVNEYTREKTEDPVKLVFTTNEIVQLANHTILISKDGTERAIEDTAAPIKENTGKTIGCVVVFRDFSEKKERQRQIEYLSYHDQLTGLFNRRFFEEEMKRLDTSRNLPLSIVYADVNGLKMVNDAFGHKHGDRLIQTIAEAFKASCRDDDIIARVGGDEFIVLLPKTDTLDAQKLVMRLKERTKQITVMDIEISIAFGWDTKKDETKPILDTIKTAEELMYQKKILASGSKRNGIVVSILNTLLVKSPSEEAHSSRVSILCEAIGRAYRLDADAIKLLGVLGKLHDIGKIAVDESVLNSSTKLSTSEWAQIKQHPEIGYRLLGATGEFNVIAIDVLAHHERWDGRGYPKGLKGDAITWNARVVAIADSYDAMVSERPYKKSLSMEEAIIEIKKNSGTQFDPKIAKIFIEKVIGRV